MSRHSLRKVLAHEHAHLTHMPVGRCDWDLTLASLAYQARLETQRRPPDLNAWAARHGVPPSRRYAELGEQAWVLWHGTTGQRAQKIIEHGLFHKRGLWTTTQPRIAHGYCRGRSAQFQTGGAMVCILLDRRAFQQGRDFEVEPVGSVFRFQHGLSADVVEYILLPDRIRFEGSAATEPQPWMRGRFKRRSGRWVPIQKTPVRYADAADYSTPEEFAALAVRRLLAELGRVTAMEVFSTLYATIDPWDALEHEAIFDLLEDLCVPGRHQKARIYRAKD